MAITLTMPPTNELKPRILVFGIGGAGGNAVNNMITAQLEGVEFVVANTDAQALAQALTDNRIQLGMTMTQGLGAGSRPDVGRGAAEEAMDQIVEQLRDCHMCFIAAGLGGGTGTGAAPIVARAAGELGVLTVGVVTKPFQFEGARRMAIAEQGIEELQHFVDTLIVIPNQNLFRIANEKTTFADAFKMADDVLHAGVRGVTDLMVMPGLINLDFADVRTVMSEMGKAMMGTGESSGEDRAIQSAEAAISNPLLDDVSLKGARGVLINITGGADLTLYEVDEAANKIRNEVDADANIIVGSTFDAKIDGSMRVSVVATGIDAAEAGQDQSGTVATPWLRAVETRPAGLAAPGAAPGAANGSLEAQPAANVGGLQPVAPQPGAAASGTGTVVLGGGGTVVLGGGGTANAAALATTPESAIVVAPVVEAEPDPVPDRERGDAPFMAPRPMQPDSRREAQRAPDPFREAALVNRPRAKSPRAAPQSAAQSAPGTAPAAAPQSAPQSAPRAPKGEASLFERLTGTGRARSEPAPTATGGGAAPVAAAGDLQSQQPTPPLAASQAAPSAAQTEPAAPPPVKPDPDPRLLTPGPEEPNLDIPAFLRRQAN